MSLRSTAFGRASAKENAPLASASSISIKPVSAVTRRGSAATTASVPSSIPAPSAPKVPATRTRGADVVLPAAAGGRSAMPAPRSGMPSHVATPNSYMSSANGKISASPAVSGLSADGAVSTSVLSAFGLPSFGRELSHIFTSDVSEEFGTDYAVILRKNMAKKNYQMSFKDHDNLVKQLVDETKAALADVLARRSHAMEAARQFEEQVAAKFAQASHLQAQLHEIAAAKKVCEGQIADLKRELEETREAVKIAEAREQEANAEIDEANVIIEDLNGQMAALDERVRGLEEKLAESDAINQGLEDDKEELREKVAELQAEVAEAAEKHASQMQSEVDAAAKANAHLTAKAAQLSAEVVRLETSLSAMQARVQDLERSAGVAEMDLAKVKAERDTAALARANLQSELERTHRQQENSQSSLMTAMEQFHRTQELHMQRERDLTHQVESMTARIQALTEERDALRASEAELKLEVREASTRERSLTASLEAAQATISGLQAELQSTHASVKRLEGELDTTQRTLDTAQAEAAACKEDLQQKLCVLEAQLNTANDKITTTEAALVKSEAREKELTATNAELSLSKSNAEDSIASLSKELETLRESYGATEESQLDKLCQVSKEAETLRRRVREMAELKARLASAEAQIKHMEEEAFEGELARRALHNQVQELKGNIRVYVRVRPFLSGDGVPGAAEAVEEAFEDEEACAGEHYADEDVSFTMPAHSSSAASMPSQDAVESAIVCAPDGTSLDILQPPPRGTKLGFTKREQPPVRFTFDTVFGPRSTQEDIFMEVNHLVQSALDGYNVCLFSYGQTGSGKTHTMQGGAGEQAGLIPRSVKQILSTAERLSGQGWQYSLEVSFLEIYNENIRDLLRVAKAGAKAEDVPLVIHQDAEGGIEVPGLTRVAVCDIDAIDALLLRASKRRAVAATAMNEQSSRSHQVFTLYIRGVHQGKGIAVCGALNLCDLAGSERLARSGAEGERKKEAVAINKSLSCLADVFTALAKKAPHIPFRNSKLTQLLQPCFRGDGKTLMLVNLSPTMESVQESLCSLRFAAQVSQVELGKPKKRIVEALAPSEASTSSAPVAAGRASIRPTTAAYYDASASATGAAADARAIRMLSRPQASTMSLESEADRDVHDFVDDEFEEDRDMMPMAHAARDDAVTFSASTTNMSTSMRRGVGVASSTVPSSFSSSSGGGSCSSVTGVKRPAAGSSAAAYHDGNTRVGEAPAKRMAVADGRPSIRSALSTAVSTGRLAGHTAAATPTSATVRRGSASVLPATSSAPPLVSSAIKRALVTGRATTLK